MEGNLGALVADHHIMEEVEVLEDIAAEAQVADLAEVHLDLIVRAGVHENNLF